MYPFQYVAAKDIQEVVSLLEQYGDRARCMAGGTDVIVQARGGRFDLDIMVDIKAVPEVTELTLNGTGLRLGAATPCYRVYGDDKLRATYAGIVDAALIIGGIQIQSRASLGGNLCNASPSADGIGPLIVHKAIAVVAGPIGRREMPVDEFCVAPGQNAMGKDEFLLRLEVPAPPARSGSAYQRFIPRNEMDIAVAGVAVAVTLDAKGETIESARIALAAVGPTPILAKAAGDSLAGKAATPETIQVAADLAITASNPIDDMRGSVDQRRHLVGVLTKRVLTKAIERARGSE